MQDKDGWTRRRKTLSGQLYQYKIVPLVTAVSPLFFALCALFP